MLTIRDQQMNALATMRTGRFTEKMVRYIATDFPSRYETLKEAGVRAWIADIFQFASQFGVVSEGAIATMVQLSMLYGARLECSPDAQWAYEILSKVAVPDTVRLQMIRERLTSRTDGRAIRRFEPGVPTE